MALSTDSTPFPSILKLQYNRLFVSAAQFPFDYVISSAVFEKLLDKRIKSCVQLQPKNHYEDIYGNFS